MIVSLLNALLEFKGNRFKKKKEDKGDTFDHRRMECVHLDGTDHSEEQL